MAPCWLEGTGTYCGHQRKQFPSREQGGWVGQNSAGQGWEVQEIQPSYRRPVGNAFISLFSILKTLMHQSLPWCARWSMVRTLPFPNVYPLDPMLFITKATFTHWLEYPYLSYTNVLCTFGSISGRPLLFHWAGCLFMCHLVLFTKVLRWVLRTGETSPSSFFFSSLGLSWFILAEPACLLLREGKFLGHFGGSC